LGYLTKSCKLVSKIQRTKVESLSAGGRHYNQKR
jgi:hypothetical protein